ncbi:hypothetical protein [Imhoffiella purpurea]|uniref:hypothetical protein n=1 Tax=Imhoffiella purpurea TaxID=1249627 RepID=UPI0012FE2B24|nr:hypothetical protein [Imhoffiella purpurea]
MLVRYFTAWDVIVFFISLLIFLGIVLGGIDTDIQAHALYISAYLRGEVPPTANFLYYIVVYAVSFFDSDNLRLLVASALVLAVSVSGKYIVTRMFVSRYLADKVDYDARLNLIVLSGCALLLLAFSLPVETFYVGQVPPNVWHNSTTIFVMPAALLLFWVSYDQLVTPTVWKAVLLVFLCAVNLIAKPSYLFVFLLAYPVMLLLRYGIGSKLWYNLIPVLLAGAGLLLQYYLIFMLSYNSVSSEASGVDIAPFYIWGHYSSNIFVSFLASVVFPLFFLVFYWRDLKNEILLQYALVGYVVAIAVFVLFTETGPRQFHGNFFWQCVISTYILFMVVMARFAVKIKVYGAKSVKNMIVMAAFLTHVSAGLLYLAVFFLRNNYY